MDNDEEGARLTRREENRELIAKHRATVEPRGCPTPGSCSAVEELADLKQRILPQFQGRTQRAEHERDALLEELIVRRTAIANLHEEINEMREKLRAATSLPVDHGYDRSASLNAGQYVCTCAAGRVLHKKTCALKRRPDAGEKP